MPAVTHDVCSVNIHIPIIWFDLDALVKHVQEIVRYSKK